MARLSSSEHRRIVVAVSGSEESMHATAVAAHLVAQRGELVFVHVVEVPLEFTLDDPPPADDAVACREGRELIARCQSLAERYGVSSRKLLVRRHAPGPAIIEAAERCAASLIVITGEQRFSSSGRARLGGTATHVLKHADCRVLLLSAGGAVARALERVA